MMTKAHKTALLAGRRIHWNDGEGVLKCGEVRRAGIRNNTDKSEVTCEDCLKGKAGKGKVGRPKGSKNKIKDDENDGDETTADVKQIGMGGYSITIHGQNKAAIKRLLSLLV